MDFQDITQKVECPYNSNHVFDKQKLIFHLNRCKDKEKVKHLFGSCQYNKIHIFKKEDLETHELICPDKDDIRQLTQQLRSTLRDIESERERSRQKLKKQDIIKEEKDRHMKKQSYGNEEDEIIGFEDCPLCKRIIDKLPEMKKEGISKELRQKILKVQKLLKVADQLQKLKVKLEG